MSCTNCFNGCTDITSDKCVKYTGPAIPALGIETGDTLAAVEAAIFQFLVPVLTGEGVLPTIDSEIICEAISQYLPNCAECDGFTLNDILTAIIKTVCSLQEQIDDIVEELAVLNADYDTSCLGSEIGGGTHNVLQAVLDKICLIDNAIAAVILDLVTNYVAIADIDTYIQAYLDSESNFMYQKMVPWVAVPYFGSLSYFDLTGAGTGDWIKIYLCNGNNTGVPDMRGRVPVGTTTMGSNPFNPAVDPGIPGNPTYILNAVGGVNNVTLTTAQMPNHTHNNTAVSTDAGHTHEILDAAIFASNVLPNGGSGQYFQKGTGETETGVADITTVITNEAQGGGASHTNIQPVIACHYIIYIP
jgi:microcystin-dependent protein